MRYLVYHDVTHTLCSTNKEVAVKLSASHLVSLLGGAAVAGAAAPEPTLLVTTHALLIVVGMWIVRVVEPSR